MQNKMIVCLLLLQGCSINAQTDSTDETTAVQQTQTLPSVAENTVKQGDQPMQTLLQENQWQLISYSTAQGMQPALPERLATLLFSGHKVSGSTGCNQYFAIYQVAAPNRLQFSKAGTTMMACQDGTAEQERQYLLNLADIHFYQIKGEQLMLFDAENKLRLEFQEMPALTLQSNVWEVTGINNGRGGVVSSAYTHRAHLQFSVNQLQGSSGCNALAASYQADGDTISIGSVSSTRKFCAEEGLMTQEQQMIVALSQVTQYEIRTHQLRLLDSAGSLMMSLKAKQ